MNGRTRVVTLFLMPTALFLFNGIANASVELMASAQVRSDGYARGDVILVVLSLSADGAVVAGVDLDIVCESPDVQIKAITWDQAFPLSLVQEPGTLPAQRVHAVRGQALTGVRAGGPAAGASPVATIQLEVIRDGAFTAHVRITGKASVIGREPEATRFSADGPAELLPDGVRIRIDNAATTAVGVTASDAPGLSNASMAGDGLVASEALDLEVWPAGGDRPVTTLSASREYELVYDVGVVSPSLFAIFVIGDANDVTIATATPPAMGASSEPGAFNFTSDPLGGRGLPAPGYADGSVRLQSVHGNLSLAEGGATENDGSLMNFRPDGSGILRLHVFLWAIDPTTGAITELSQKLELTVR